MQKHSLILAAVALCVCAPLPASAQANAPAELSVVKKGVFTLKQGQSMDLTDRGILLHVRKIRGQQGEQSNGVELTVNGGLSVRDVGARIDLKVDRDTRDFLKDVRSCVLDLVGASLPVGAPTSATFRLMCE